MFSTLFTVVPLALFAVTASAESRPRAMHNSLAKRLSGDLTKRYSNTRWSFYDVGLGACGTTNVASDYIVALNQATFGTTYPSSYCNKQITMTYNGVTATATIMDSCPGCPTGGLDLSRGLFTHFASEDTGIIYGEWSFVDDDTSATTTTKAATTAATTTTKAAATTTSYKVAAVAATTSKTSTSSKTSTKPATTSKTSAVATTTAATSSSKAVVSSSKFSSMYASASASASILASSAAALPSSSATADSTTQITDNIAAINDLLTQLGSLIMTAGVDDDST